MPTSRIVTYGGGFLVLCLLAVAGFELLTYRPAPPLVSDVPGLRVSAGRNASGFSLTNREAESLSRCEVRLRDQDATEWEAVITETILPSQTVAVEWERFVNRGQPAPSYIGLNQPRFLVSCWLTATQARRSAELS